VKPDTKPGHGGWQPSSSGGGASSSGAGSSSSHGHGGSAYGGGSQAGGYGGGGGGGGSASGSGSGSRGGKSSLSGKGSRGGGASASGSMPATAKPGYGLYVGADVTVLDLKSAAQFNGQSGKIIDFDKTLNPPRWEVLTTDPASFMAVNLKAKVRPPTPRFALAV
jgi:hypothetical protein